MNTSPPLRMVYAVTVRVPHLEQGLRFYRDRLGYELFWRNDTGRRRGGESGGGCTARSAPLGWFLNA
jgi:catechol 2,3-dioxygenase-like lactoylglutathione lyase family enzyme